MALAQVRVGLWDTSFMGLELKRGQERTYFFLLATISKYLIPRLAAFSCLRLTEAKVWPVFSLKVPNT